MRALRGIKETTIMVQNISRWIVEGKKSGIDLSSLGQDKMGMHQTLAELGLPRPQVHIIKKEILDSKTSKTIDSIFEESDFFCRLIPKDKSKIRPYRLRLKSKKDFINFVSKYELDNYIIQLVERDDVTHTGAIIVQKEIYEKKSDITGRCIAELVKGDGPNLFHGYKTPVHAELDFTRAIKYSREGAFADDLSRQLIYQALKHIGGPKNPFPGYYEFSVWNKEKIVFRNYQPPESPWAKI
ncbi:MAG: hypothetical protein Q8O89_04580 [Nanoarchaeota archaeon]|nr:hypothetical protein [Nanoarchaeota archaeon]